MKRYINISDFRKVAQKKIPKMAFDYIDGGADDEVTMARSSSAFDHYALCPAVLNDVSDIDLSTTVMGTKIDMPLIISPTAQARIFHHTGERSLAKAAAKFGTIYTLSSISSVSIEDTAKAAGGPKWFQIYVMNDRQILRDYIQKCKEAGYAGLCLTVDVPLTGNRERDIINGTGVPPKFTARNVFNILSKPTWLWNRLTNPRVSMSNIEPYLENKDMGTLAKFTAMQLSKNVSWEDALWMKEEWGGKFAIKGIMRADDARRAAEAGFDAVIVSNHGGRQLDQVAAPIEVLQEIVEAVDGRCEVILDGGIRRGTDILKALAMGATACMTGRPFLFGLAAEGQAGVERALEIFRNELELDMLLLGRKDIKSIRSSDVRKL
jgi:L-lactate dehydrogenase (cytochrome)